MKIVAIDNFARESVADQLVAENVPEFYAESLRDFLQSKFGGEQASRYYQVFPDDHVLWRGIEEFI